MRNKSPAQRQHGSRHIYDVPKPDTREHLLWLQNAESSPFLRLPPEIRNRIYALVLTIGQIHVRYHPWHHRRRIQKGKHFTETIRGGYYAVVFDANQDPWTTDASLHANNSVGGGLFFSSSSSPTSSPPSGPFRVGGGLGLGTVLTLLSPVCRQLYRETTTLPFCLNTWSFENTHIMERYLLRDKSLALAQRRAICVLIANDLPTRSIESSLSGLRLIIWKNGKKFHRWELGVPVQDYVPAKATRGWQLYE